jgi:hypothetical protein
MMWTRRKFLESIGRAGGASAVHRTIGAIGLLSEPGAWTGQGVSVKAETTGGSFGVEAGYGPDPNLITPSTPWPCTLSHEQKDSLTALSDTLLPPIGKMPAPSEIGIVEFLDEWLSAPYQQQQRDRTLILSGLTALDSDSQPKFGHSFRELTTDKRQFVLDSFATDTDENAIRRPFFQRIRYLVVGGYYTSDVGLRAIGYRGNVPLQNYDSLPSEVYGTINAELVRLGLPPQQRQPQKIE